MISGILACFSLLVSLIELIGITLILMYVPLFYYIPILFRSRVPPSSACSTCFCQICGEDSATATCYSCSSMYSDSDYKQLERKSSIKSISKIGDRTLAIIETDSDSSLGSFGSIDSPKTAWMKSASMARCLSSLSHQLSSLVVSCGIST